MHAAPDSSTPTTVPEVPSMAIACRAPVLPPRSSNSATTPASARRAASHQRLGSCSCSTSEAARRAPSPGAYSTECRAATSPSSETITARAPPVPRSNPITQGRAGVVSVREEVAKGASKRQRNPTREACARRAEYPMGAERPIVHTPYALIGPSSERPAQGAEPLEAPGRRGSL